MRNKFIWITVACLSLVSLFLLASVQPDSLKVDILSVGQGDSILIRTPGHHQILIDGGPDGTAVRDLGRLMPFYDHEIDLVVLTHPHADHYVGLTALLNRYKVDRLLWNGVKGTAPDYQPLQAVLEKKHVATVVADHKVSFDFGDGVRLSTIYPNRKLTGTETEDPNVTSIISVLDYGSNSVLLTGDTSETVEQVLVANHLIHSDTVLKVAHHGSKTGTDSGLLASIRPKFAVISVGRNNRYGHPAPETLLKLKGIKTYRTDKDGTVEFSSKAGLPFTIKAHALHD